MLTRSAGPAITLFLLMFCLPCDAENVSAHNTSRYIGDDHWEWTIFITAPPTLLAQIKCVEYTLHPTFPKPSRRSICDPGTSTQSFPFTATGWGTFDVPVRIIFRDGRVQNLTHTLAFIKGPIAKPLALSTGNTAKEIKPGLWEWTVYLQGSEDVLNRVQCVEYTLHPTFADPIRRVCSRGRGSQAFPLMGRGWGTFKIRLRVFLKDGQVQNLEHDLKFS
jgi:transcription initiation factor IIF auxiliary subunit